VRHPKQAVVLLQICERCRKERRDPKQPWANVSDDSDPDPRERQTWKICRRCHVEFLRWISRNQAGRRY